MWSAELFKIPDAPPKKAPDGITETISTVGTLAFTWNVSLTVFFSPVYPSFSLSFYLAVSLSKHMKGYKECIFNLRQNTTGKSLGKPLC